MKRSGFRPLAPSSNFHTQPSATTGSAAVALERHRLWHDAWLVCAGAAASAAALAISHDASAIQPAQAAACGVASIALGVAAIGLRTRLLSRDFLRREIGEQAGNEATRRATRARETRALVRLWACAAAVAGVGTLAAYTGLAWVAAADAAFAATVLLASPPKMLADSV